MERGAHGSILGWWFFALVNPVLWQTVPRYVVDWPNRYPTRCADLRELVLQRRLETAQEVQAKKATGD